jgi:cytoskeletal protein RodZ
VLPVDPTAETVEASPLDDDANPFRKPSRWRGWLKRPSREFMIRGAVAAIAAAIGWGAGAKPWQPAPDAAKVALASKPPGAARPAAGRAAAPASRRVAVSDQNAAAAKPRTATKPVVATATKKPAATQPAPTAGVAKVAKTSTSTKTPVKATATKPTAKSTTQAKTSASGGTTK